MPLFDHHIFLPQPLPDLPKKGVVKQAAGAQQFSRIHNTDLYRGVAGKHLQHQLKMTELFALDRIKAEIEDLALRPLTLLLSLRQIWLPGPALRSMCFHPHRMNLP